ncbi:hypothetical protein [endosymbiont GvMRE of Glomus versiforme]|uniref:hypothetical protein n=1 Tax=endosymbiont GvMRE of Glomus versiforme TaxID=2039283 RepID=UPI000EDB7599|nr:hypothetical protein [endosymbiont GvMRE of Glomus versiforme]RHZ37682.1 hypothetical protein GvMRE_I1g19 [endosymbiont GvMRE of Glomus versiforme]
MSENNDLTLFRMSITWVEKYIEQQNYYDNWQGRKQTDTSLILHERTNESILESLGISLFIEFGTPKGKEKRSPAYLEIRKNEFYKWIDGTKIQLTELPKKLKLILVKFHEVIKDKEGGWKIFWEIENSEDKYEPNSPEYEEEMKKMYSSFYEARGSREDWKDKLNKSFTGDSQQGKTTFEAIANSLSDSEKENFSFWLQKNSEKQEIKENQDNKEQETKTTKPAPEKEHPKTTKTILIIGGVCLLILSLMGFIFYYWKKNAKRK